MKKIILSLAFLASALTSQAQSIYNSGAHIVSQAGTCWVVEVGTLRNDGVFAAEPGSTVILNGTSAQSIGGSNPTTFGNLILNNNFGISLSKNISVEGSLDFQNGMLTTGNSTLTMGASGSFLNANSTKFVDGKLALTFTSLGSKGFPLGKNGVFRPITIQYTGLTGTSVVTAEQFESPLTGTLPVNVSLLTASRYWNISQTGGSGLQYLLTLDATGYTPTGAVVGLKKDAGTIASYATTAPDYTNAMALTSFGEFALGNLCALPGAPRAGTIIQPTCKLLTGLVILNGLPSGTWTLIGTSSTGTVIKTGSGPATIITGLSAGTTYTFTVTNASGCTSLPSGNVVINPQPTAPAAPAVGSQSFCGSATVADLPQRSDIYTYRWYSTPTGGSSLSGFARLNTGLYYVSQISGDCESAKTRVTVTINALPAAFKVSGGGTYCSGGSGLTVKLSGSTAGVNYQLYLNGSTVPGAIVSGTGSAVSFINLSLEGTYTVKAVHAITGCQATMIHKAVITVSQAPTATSIVYSKSSSGNCSTSGFAVIILFSCTPGGEFYSSPSGLSIDRSTGTINFARSKPGNHTITYSVSNPCGSAKATTTITVNRCTKAYDPANDQEATPEITLLGSELNVYPNPSNGPVRFEFSTILDGKVTLDIINIQGQLVMRLFEGNLVAGEERTVLFDGYLHSGTYIYRLTSAAGVKNCKMIRM